MVRSLLLALACLVFLADPVLAAKRALVIGNDSYAELPDLQKAVGDAQAYDRTLSRLGYDVELLTDLTGTQMRAAVGAFIDSVAVGDEVAFVYAGHGWSDGSVNYIVGTDAPRSTGEAALRSIALPLRNGTNGVLDQLLGGGARVLLAVIDACRQNPFESRLGRSGAVGLARGMTLVPPVSGSFVIYSAGHGQEALDRLGSADTHPNSVFSRVFLRELEEGGSLQDIVLDTAPRVSRLAASVGHAQRPAYYDGIGERYCLTPGCSRAPLPPAAADLAPPDTAPVAVATGQESRLGGSGPSLDVAAAPPPQPPAAADPYLLPSPEPVIAPPVVPASGGPVQFVSRNAAPVRRAGDLGGRSICSVEAAPEQSTLERFFKLNAMAINNRRFYNLEEAVAALDRNRCDALAVPPRLVQTALGLTRDPSRYLVLPIIE